MLHNGRIEIGETPLEKSASEVKADGSWPVFEGKGFPDEFGSCHEQQEKKKKAPMPRGKRVAGSKLDRRLFYYTRVFPFSLSPCSEV